MKILQTSGKTRFELLKCKFSRQALNSGSFCPFRIDFVGSCVIRFTFFMQDSTLHIFSDPGGKATYSHRVASGWMSSKNPVLSSLHRRRPLCTASDQSAGARLKSFLRTCENPRSSLLGRRDGRFWVVPAPIVHRLCPLHDHWRRSTSDEGGQWTRGGAV